MQQQLSGLASEESPVSYAHYDRLSALDASFLEIESPSVHMHVGAVAVCAGDAFATPEGGLDMERIYALAEPALRRSPRLRMRLERVPLFGRRVWVDDPAFRLDYHLRATALPAPGDARQLKRMAGRIFSQKLDLRRSPWEIWFIEGVEAGRFAVLTKIHHCMVDGVSSAGLLGGFVAASADEASVESAPGYVPRRAPGSTRLLADELVRRATLPWRAASAGLQLARAPVRSASRVGHGAQAVGSALLQALGSASATPLNEAVGPHRRFDWTRTELPTLRAIEERSGATLNDVALAVVAGAMRRFLERRGAPIEGLDFRALLPVNVSTPDRRGKPVDRVAFLIARLPVEEPDARRRIERVREATRRSRASDAALGAELVEDASEWTLGNLVARLSQLAARTRSYNMVVTNVPGPEGELRLLGARLEEVYPLVPLFSNQALGIALVPYGRSLFWGFNADWDAVPDLHEVVEDVEQELETLAELGPGGRA